MLTKPSWKNQADTCITEFLALQVSKETLFLADTKTLGYAGYLEKNPPKFLGTAGEIWWIILGLASQPQRAFKNPILDSF